MAFDFLGMIEQPHRALSQLPIETCGDVAGAQA
jgi:hypothetical protein